ncbi:phosphatidate cytidylyltransferase [Mobiluncus mulieris]|uniref:Phosphatidate cytidylyltransferase n=2 Tax=Mobiluncus mulieris TaxID=2052 RepID=A0A7Y0U0Y1_9ACTO|nr:phosphatidate cytidylyltransferase [Mobiluncus mulieris]
MGDKRMASARRRARPRRDTTPGGSAAPPVVTEEKKSGSRAGRDLGAAFLVGGGLLAFFGLTLLFVPVLFRLAVIIAMMAGLLEFRRVWQNTDLHLATPVTMVGGAGIFICASQMGVEAMLIATLFTVGAGILWHLTGESRGEKLLRNVSATALTVAYIPFLTSFVGLLSVECGGPATAVYVLATTLGSDTGGYVVGRFLGRHHMTPVISPKKTWEGFAGSVVFAVAISIAGTFWIGIPWFYGPILGVLIAIFATLGDLSESLLKRELGIKDMGHILPGHGGLLDRMDSLLMAAPVAYIILKFAIHFHQVLPMS